jgi:hypothetical protein
MEPLTHHCYTRLVASKDTEVKDADKADKESRSATDNSESDESELGAVKPKTTGEPADNLHRRAEWFKKRHGG